MCSTDERQVPAIAVSVGERPVAAITRRMKLKASSQPTLETTREGSARSSTERLRGRERPSSDSETG